MNDIDYLSQIAKDNRVVAKPSEKFPIDKKWLKIIIGAVALVILMMIVGGILGGLGGGERGLLDKIYARSTNLNMTISEFGNKVKSSELRAMGNSLSTVLSETSAKVAGLLTLEYGAKGTEPQDETTTTAEAEHIAGVNGNLEYGRLNGFLDRYFVREMSREIVLLQSLETEAIEKSSASSVREALAQSWNNLNQLATQFENYSSLAD